MQVYHIVHTLSTHFSKDIRPKDVRSLGSSTMF